MEPKWIALNFWKVSALMLSDWEHVNHLDSLAQLIKAGTDAVLSVDPSIIMLPKNRLGRKMFKKLFVYAGDAHPHGAQQPKELKF